MEKASAGFCARAAKLDSKATLLSSARWWIEPSHVTPQICCCDLGCGEPLELRQEACLLTQLCVYADFTSHPPAALACTPLQILPFFHFLILLSSSSCWTNPPFSPTTIPTFITSLCLLSRPAPAVCPAPCPFVLSPPSHIPSSISSPSLPSPSKP